METPRFLSVRCDCPKGWWMAGIRDDSRESIEVTCRCGKRWYASVVDGEVKLEVREPSKRQAVTSVR